MLKLQFKLRPEPRKTLQKVGFFGRTKEVWEPLCPYEAYVEILDISTNKTTTHSLFTGQMPSMSNGSLFIYTSHASDADKIVDAVLPIVSKLDDEGWNVSEVADKVRIYYNGAGVNPAYYTPGNIHSKVDVLVSKK